MEISIILNQMSVLFILMTLGFVLGKCKIFTQEGNKTLTKIVIFIALPATVINSILQSELVVTLNFAAFAIAMSFLTFLLAFLISYPIIRLTVGEKADRGLYTFLTMFGNSAVLGIPVIVAVFGVEAAFYAALYNIAFNVLVFSVGLMMVSRKVNKFDPRMLLNPTLLITFLIIPLAVTNVRFPFQIEEPIRLIGEFTTPTAMFVIGSTLAYIPVKAVLAQWQIYPITILKLVVVPIIVWLVLRPFITNEMFLSVLVVLSAMPTAVSAPMLAIEYDGDEGIASAGVFMTTLLCGITIPVLLYFLFT